MNRYSFHDTGSAEVRLALLAETFEPEMHVLLAGLPKRPFRLALDLGCGPGFTTYLSVVESLIADSGGTLYLGPRLSAADPNKLRRLSSEIYRAPVSTGDAAKMFSLNLSAWRSDRFVVDNYETSFLDVLARRLDQLQVQTSSDRIEWGIRHIVYERFV